MESTDRELEIKYSDNDWQCSRSAFNLACLSL